MTIEVSSIWQGAVCGEHQVAIDISREQADELRKALSIVQKYEKMALAVYKESDWCEIDYSVKNDKVLVLIRDGMAG